MRDAIELLGLGTVQTLAERIAAIDFFEPKQPWDVEPERFRLTRWPCSASPIGSRARSTTRTATSCSSPPSSRHRQARALEAYPGYPRTCTGRRARPRRGCAPSFGAGVDHSLVHGVLAQRWCLPSRLATPTERHDSDEAAGDAAIVRSADMLVTT